MNTPQTAGQPTSERACTIIVATLAKADRAASLLRAVSSISDANASPITILVVVNGNAFDSSVVSDLERRPDIRVMHVAQPSLANAILAGRAEVQTPFFGFLDDDDEYLPNAIDRRLTALLENPEADVVITNGLRRSRGRESKAVERLGSVEMDPLIALFRENWLASCNALYRTASVAPSLFEDNHDYMEWTWLAFRLVTTGLRISVLDEPTFVINDTPTSASKSPACLASSITLYHRILAQTPRSDIAPILRRRLSTAYHCLSDYQMREGPIKDAWLHHLYSLGGPGGLRYLTFSLRLLGATIVQKGSSPE